MFHVKHSEGEIMDKNKYQHKFNEFIQDLRYTDNCFVSLVNNKAIIYYHYHDMVLSYYLTYDYFESQYIADKYKYLDNIINDMKKEYIRQVNNNIKRALRGFDKLCS